MVLVWYEGGITNILTIAGIAITAGLAAMIYVGKRHIGFESRKSEWNDNEEAEPQSRGQLSWNIIHIRDDVGSIFGFLVIIIGLLVSIIVIMLLK